MRVIQICWPSTLQGPAVCSAFCLRTMRAKSCERAGVLRHRARRAPRVNSFSAQHRSDFAILLAYVINTHVRDRGTTRAA